MKTQFKKQDFWIEAFNWIKQQEDSTGIYCTGIYEWNPHYNIIKFWMRGVHWKLYQPYLDTGLGPVLLNVSTAEWKEFRLFKEAKSYLKKYTKNLK